MKIVQINGYCGSGSTGKICVAVSELLTAQNIENYILYNVGNSDYPLGIKYMSRLDLKFQALKAKVFGNYGFQSKSATKRLIEKIEDISPDIIQLHNLHSHNVNLPMLFSYLKKKNIKIFWTFHDCFAFTAYCMYFDMAGCDRWKEGCHNCPQCHKYSYFFDRSKTLYKMKKDFFSDLDMTIITPSYWLADLVKESFLKNYPVKVIHNGIDLAVFSPKESDFREKNNISTDKTILLGVANNWEPRKGRDVFVKLAEILDGKKYQIVLVGTNDSVDKKLPSNIISIHRTQNQAELAEIYSVADIFVNPTREEALGMVNVESLACGTPVITYKTGGSPECIDESCGIVVEKDDVDGLIQAIEDVASHKPFSQAACVARAQAFNADQKFSEYVNLYIHQNT